MALLSTSQTKTIFSSGIILTSFSILGFSISGCQQQPQYGYIEGETMGTSYHISYQRADNVDDQELKTSIDNRLQEINDSMSTYIEESTISKFNKIGGGESLTIDADFINVFKDSKEVYRLSDGAFDPTVMPLINLWGFGKTMTVDRLQNPPTMDEILEAKRKIDFDNLTLNGDQLIKTKSGIELDFSAVAKGYGVDAIANVLHNDYKINNYMVEIGGEVATSGLNQNTHPWQIAIDAPIIDSSIKDRLTIAVIGQPKATHKLNLATSGNYRNSVVYNNKRYSHTIDPNTGQPIAGGAPSVSVAAESVALADAWATALTAMPYDKALTTATDNDLAALFVIPKDGKIHDEIPSAEALALNKKDPLAYWQVVETPAMQRLRSEHN